MKLLIENWQKYLKEINVGFDLAKSIEYTAFVLDEESHQKLARLAPDGWRVFAHHMTIVSPADNKLRLPPDQFFNRCLTVDAIAKNKAVVAVRVRVEGTNQYFKSDAIPHITIATNGGTPMDSINFREEDYQPIESIEICGNTEEIPREF